MVYDTVMKGSELVAIAKSKGWYFLRHGSRHDIYVHDVHPYPVQIPRHKSQEVPRGTLASILKQLNGEGR